VALTAVDPRPVLGVVQSPGPLRIWRLDAGRVLRTPSPAYPPPCSASWCGRICRRFYLGECAWEIRERTTAAGERARFLLKEAMAGNELRPRSAQVKLRPTLRS
jgi:hypothetical protein